MATDKRANQTAGRPRQTCRTKEKLVVSGGYRRAQRRASSRTRRDGLHSRARMTNERSPRRCHRPGRRHEGPVCERRTDRGPRGLGCRTRPPAPHTDRSTTGGSRDQRPQADEHRPLRPLGSTLDKWLGGGRACAVVSGGWSLSSNSAEPEHGGLGGAIDAEGVVVATTSSDERWVTVEVDLAAAEAAKEAYPRYVPELPAR